MYFPAVTHDIGNGVRLARARGSLHGHPVGTLQLFDNSDLFVVVRQRKEKLARLARSAHTASRQSAKCDGLVVWGFVRRRSNEGLGTSREW